MFGNDLQRRSGGSGRLLAVVALAVATVFAMVSPIQAGTSDWGKHRRTPISGEAVPSDCNNGEGAAAIELTGDLEGCWIFFPESLKCTESNGFAFVQESGRETFDGTFRGQEGTFSTRYTLEATFTSGSCAEFDAGGFPFEAQLTGGCKHRIRGETGVFKGKRGLITIFDVIPDPGVSGATNFLWTGYLR